MLLNLVCILKSPLVGEVVASTSGNLEEVEHSDPRNNMEVVGSQLAAAVPGHNLDWRKEPRCTFLEVDHSNNKGEVLVELAQGPLELNSSLPSPASPSNLYKLT